MYIIDARQIHMNHYNAKGFYMDPRIFHRGLFLKIEDFQNHDNENLRMPILETI